MKFEPLPKLKLKPRAPTFLERLKDALPKVTNLDDYRGRRGRRGARGVKGEQGDLGKTGVPGAQGERGAAGVPGPKGAPGTIGERGKRGYKGIHGRVGEVGPQGAPGPKGDTGPAPMHQWQGNALRFKKPNGDWGKLVNLQGPAGGRGRAGGSAAKEQFASIALDGNNLEFKKLGALGPDISIDLSALSVGGVWGDITGDIVNQTDLSAELSQARTMRYFLGE